MKFKKSLLIAFLVTSYSHAGSEPTTNADSPSTLASSSFEFKHPGILLSKTQLNFVKARKEEQPWKASLAAAIKDPHADKNYQPKARAIVNCGTHSIPDNGCTDELSDAQAAYLQALLWYYTGDSDYAETVRRILNDWAEKLERHTGDNRRLQASWTAVLFTRAAEIVKYTYGGWPQPEKDNVTKMFRDKYLPVISDMFRPTNGNDHKSNSNWQATAIEAMTNIAVFNKNKELFTEALGRWVSLTQSYIYLTSDGDRPRNAWWFYRTPDEVHASWKEPSRYLDGMPKEFCRDLMHTGYGLASLLNVAETAKLHGIDLYGLQKDRLIKAMEVTSYFGVRNNEYHDRNEYHQICNYQGDPNWPRGNFYIGFNQFALRQSQDMPYTQQFIELQNKYFINYPGKFHFQWERLSHYHVP